MQRLLAAEPRPGGSWCLPPPPCFVTLVALPSVNTPKHLQNIAKNSSAVFPAHIRPPAQSPLSRSAKHEIVRLLLDAGAAVNQQTDSTHYTPVFSAAHRGDVALARLLLERVGLGLPFWG